MTKFKSGNSQEFQEVGGSLKGVCPLQGDSEAIRGGTGLQSTIQLARHSGEVSDRKGLSSEGGKLCEKPSRLA